MTASTNPPKPTRPAERSYASSSVPRHLARGALGLGLIAVPIALVPTLGPLVLLAAPLSLIAFRGCPTCWMVGLVQTLSRDRLQRECVDGVCTLTRADPAHRHEAGDRAGAGTGHGSERIAA
ncbi:hypothetical protein [Streptomyces sp. NPDC051909]|uniref:hypothetical protein n=1 Tax=Streptomyces sp. NPDC051909 TaxID=3154944 RepID=UPI00342D97F3